MRDFFVIVGSLLIAVLLAAFAVPRFIDWTPYKHRIETRLREATGVNIALAGPLRIEILPKLALNAQDVIIDAKEAKVSAARLRAEVSVASLLAKAPRLLSLELDGGVVKLTEETATDPAAALFHLLSKGDALQIETITLNTIAVTRVDDDTPVASIERGEASFPSRAGVLRLAADGMFGTLAARGRLAIGPSDEKLERHVSLAFESDSEGDDKGWRFTFEGQAFEKAFEKASENGPSPVNFGGAVLLAQSDGVKLRAGAGGANDKPLWRAQAKAHGELRALRLEEIEITRGEATPLRLTGQGGFHLAGDPKLTLELSARRLALDPLVEANGFDLKALGATGAFPLGHALEVLAGLVTGSVPPPLSVDFNLRADTVELADESFGNLQLKGAATADELSISSANANWIGRGEVGFSGDAAGAGKALARGHVDVKAQDAAAFLQGFGFASESANARIPLMLAGELNVDPKGTSIEGLDLTLAGSRITGKLGLNAAPDGRAVRVEAELASRDLDLENWPLGAIARVVPASLTGRVQIHVDRLRAGKGAGDVGALDMSISRRDSDTSIEKLELHGFEGLSLSGGGSIGGSGSRFDARIAAPKAAPLVALSRLVLPQRAVDALDARRASLEPLTLVLSARRGATSPAVDVTLSGTAATSRLDAKATLDPDFAPNAGEVALAAPDASTLLEQLGVTIARPDPSRSDSLGRGELRMAAKPTDPGSWAITAALSAGAAKLAGDGTFRFDAGAPEGHGGLSATAPDLALAQRLLGFSRSLDGDQRLDITGGFTLSPDALALERLNAKFLGMSLNGDLNLSLQGEARLTGAIRAPSLSVPALAALALGPIRAGQGLWAAARFPPYQPPRLAVSLRLTSASIDVGGGLAGRDGKLNLDLDGRGLELASVGADLAGGKLDGDWRIERDGGLARSSLRLSVDGIDVKTLAPGAGFAGKLSGRLELAGAGETFSQIVASSGGSGSLRIADGWLEQASIGGLRRGFARAVADDNLMDKARLSAVVAAETARGALSGVNLEAPVVATNGILRTTIPRLALSDTDGAEASAALDLKTVTLDARLGLSTVSTDKPENPVPLAAAITWKGPFYALKREADANALLQAVSVERLRIELERIELLEYDQREEAMFNRRLKAGRQKAMPLPAQPADTAAPSPAPSPSPPATSASSSGTEGETAAREGAPAAAPTLSGAPAPSETPAVPPPLVRAPQPPTRTNLVPPIEAAPGSPQLAPLPPEIAVPAAPAVAPNPPLRRPQTPKPPLLLHSPD